jgi:dihydrofolate reductase
MRRLRYQVATSLDGYLAGPNGEFDWIVMDPDIDFGALFAQFDTVVMGRKTFLATLQQGGDGSMPGLDVVVFSRTLRRDDHPAVRIVNTDPGEEVRQLKARQGKDIWLFGGGELFGRATRRGTGRHRGTGDRPGAAWRRHSDAPAARRAGSVNPDQPSFVFEVRDRAARICRSPRLMVTATGLGRRTARCT